MGDAAENERISGRRAVDDGARLLIAEVAIKRVEEQYATLADGQDIISGVLIGRPQKDGTVTVGLVEQVRHVIEKQDETARKLDDVIADMGDVKTAHADQAKTLAQHGTQLDLIVNFMKAGLKWISGGVLTIAGGVALHLVTIWWNGIVSFVSALLPIAEAAPKGH